MGTSLTLLRAWASAGSRVKPSDTKIDVGWVNGDQARGDWENERMYTRDTLINAIATYLNAGVPLSDILSGQKTFVGDSLIEFARNQYETETKAEGVTSTNSVTGDITTVAAGEVKILADDGAYTSQTADFITAVGETPGQSVMRSGYVGNFGTTNTLASWLTSTGLVFRASDFSMLENVRPLSIDLSGTTWTGSAGNYNLSGTIFFEDHNFEDRSIMGAMISWDDAVGNRRSASVQEIAFVDDTADTVINALGVTSSESPQGKSNLTLNFWYMDTGGAIVP